jgi:hypothetical protein
MERLTEEEIETIRKFYRMYGNVISEINLEEFLDSLTSYNKEKHYNDEELEKTVTEIVYKYFEERGRTVYPFGPNQGSFVITVEDIDGRKNKMIEWIKSARDNERCQGHVYRHYDGGACATSDELHSFYCYVFNHYYDSIGTTWEYK